MSLHAGTTYLALTTGTPVQVSSVVTLLGSSALGYGKWAQSVKLQAHPDNTAVAYIGLAGMNITTGLNVLGVLPKPSSATTGPFPSDTYSEPLAPNGLALEDLYVQGTTGDKIIVSFTQQ